MAFRGEIDHASTGADESVSTQYGILVEQG
jgi:hypothetical protein